mmetsp:Transcript_18852/g.47125  ORF Transcript_18852/g.47125 Transcript_18852/m.47125 type:complete len:123 (-) Transcript_18852:184-552(-)|eukprot:g3821.t1
MSEEKDETEETAWAAEEVDRILLETCDTVLLNEQYSDEKVSQWVNDICETAMLRLNETKKPFKWVVSCLIMHRNGAGVHSSAAAFWDTANDGLLTSVWPKDKGKNEGNKTIQAIVTVIGTEF